jgi:hypothetical protein
MARPAASSLALLTRMPEDRRCMEVASELADACKLRWAFNEGMFVLILGISILLKGRCQLTNLFEGPLQVFSGGFQETLGLNRLALPI